MRPFIPVALAVAALLTLCCGKNEDTASNEISFLLTTDRKVGLEPGSEYQIVVKCFRDGGESEEYDMTSDELGLTFESSDTKVVTVDTRGLVKAGVKGNASVKVSSRKKPALRCSMEFSVGKQGALYNLATPFSNDMAFSCLSLGGFTDRQCFDFDSKGNLYHACTKIRGMVGYLCIMKTDKEGNSLGEMNMYYAGHGQSISVEEDGEDVYIWVCNCGTKNSDARGYGKCQIVSRIKFEPGKECIPEETDGDHFYINGKSNFEVSLDRATDKVAINSTEGSYDVVRVYDRKELLASPVSTITTGTVTRGTNKVGPVEGDYATKVTMRAHDLTNLKTVASFSVSREKVHGYKAGSSSIKALQGFCMYDDRVYFLCDADRNARDVTLGCCDLSGNVVHGPVHIGAVDDIESIKAVGFGVDSGYYECEGLQFYNDDLYVGFLCWDSACKNSILKLK